jgi:hypothetical protein
MIEYRNIQSLQPSQLYISKQKLAAVESWLSENIDTYEPIPIKELDGRIVSTDGHTRLFALSRMGIQEARVVWDEDDLDWDAYRICVQWCLEEGINSVIDMENRILDGEDYQRLWLDRCKKMQEELAG